MSPLISVIVPVYNHAHTLARCLASIRSQTYQPVQIIVVNDGSTDNFSHIKNKLRVQFDFILLEQTNQGAPAARNAGFREATGEYVIFLDADTVAKLEMLERLERQLREHPEASYAYSQFKFGWKIMRGQNFKAADLKKYNYIDTTSLIRREALKNIPGPFDINLKRFQDWDLWLTLLEQNKIGTFVPEVLFKKIVSGRQGISRWLPSFLYNLPWKTKSVREYEQVCALIRAKHRLL